MSSEIRTAGIVLCGGKSRRMGQEKYRLMFAGETLLQRICRIVSPEVSQILVVASSDQEIPALSSSVQILRDEIPECGPLAGIAQALAHLHSLDNGPHIAFVTSCDVPLLKTTVIPYLQKQLTDSFDAVVVKDSQYAYPLCAIYRTTAAATAERLLATGERRAAALSENLETCWVPVDQLRHIDPDLESFWNCNSPEEFSNALRRGLEMEG